ncbi:GrpB family protein [Amycolatopsis cihanbeyliensis]|uniref:GrpB-like predicted nucleotidyltransferase (UPF0157 family) n=1 Tax=Amycolatopsis cihanbeyliensis TaxID=1128664 RepID=A0A542DD90_AMYCI|nr:GrpB family protein [Amycolatopsis cihanbeyliensis]TQJ01031.1 GrpB-like predicted nucleotidyltransferase (UPF0157 family) [Amycolatopsis cihanbeyliensis]
MAGEVPAWAYAQPVLRPHDEQWMVQADRECAELTELLGPWLVEGVEHIGSTAVPGLAAKPVLDLMASVADPDEVVTALAGRLATEDWHYVPPETDRRPWRRFFVKPTASGVDRYAHLHLIPEGHPRWREQLAFRDALRSDAQLAREYARLKHRLADEHGNDREGYTAAKGEFVAKVLGQGS